MPESETDCLSLVVADSIRPERNGKLIFVGVYTQVKLREKTKPGPLFVFATIRTAKGPHEVGVLVTDVSANKQMRLVGQQFESSGHDAVGQMTIEVEDFEFPNSGSYIFNLLIDNEPVGEHLAVVEFPEEAPAQPARKVRKKRTPS